MEANNDKAEAERWVTIAEKLLTVRDLVGSKTFAIRACESDPKLEPAEQILAVANTLIAGETRINNQQILPFTDQAIWLVQDTTTTLVGFNLLKFEAKC